MDKKKYSLSVLSKNIDAYTLNNKIKVYHWYRDDSYSIPKKYLKKDIDSLVEKIKRNETNYYGNTDLYLYNALNKYSIENKSVAIIGSNEPWYESVVINYKGKPTTIEYNKIETDDDRLNILTVEEYNNKQKFDVLISISSFEHDGLGRYGDPYDPNGDLKAMNKCKDMLNDIGILILSVPVGEDALYWNVHRVYGELRLPVLLQGWEILDSYGFDIKDFCYKKFDHQPIFVLKRIDINNQSIVFT